MLKLKDHFENKAGDGVEPKLNFYFILNLVFE